MCFRAAWIAMKMPRTLMSMIRSNSSSVVSSKELRNGYLGIIDEHIDRARLGNGFLDGSGNRFTVCCIGLDRDGFSPARSISLTTPVAASAPLVYVIATSAPSEANRLAMAAPIPREPPSTMAVLPSSLFCTLAPYWRGDRMSCAVTSRMRL
jgi:hypothetical protein